MPTLQEQFGAVVRRRRRAADLSQEALASAAGLHFTYISLLERGKRAPSIVVVKKVAAGLKTTMVDLVRELEEVAEEQPKPKRRK